MLTGNQTELAKIIERVTGVLAAFSKFGPNTDASLRVELGFRYEGGSISQELSLRMQNGKVEIYHSSGYAFFASPEFQQFCSTLGIECKQDGA